MPVMVKALGYFSHKAPGGLRKAKQHLKYLEHGKQHRNAPEGFNDKSDHVNRREYHDQLQRQPDRGVIAHKLVFSLSEDERNRCGANMRDLVRETMDAWSQSVGRPLNWIGFEHDDPGHPHVHVMVAGYAGGKQVGMYEKDIRALRQWSEREKGRQAERATPVKEHRTITQEVDRLTKDLERDRSWERGR